MKSMLVLFLFLAVVYSDQIIMYSPPINSTWFVNDIMDIRYRGKLGIRVKLIDKLVRAMGMIKIWTTVTQLVHVDTNTTIDSFPNLQWSMDTPKDVNQTVHATWSIPSLAMGNYTMHIIANATALCSKNKDGTMPFVRCPYILHEFRDFRILV